VNKRWIDSAGKSSSSGKFGGGSGKADAAADGIDIEEDEEELDKQDEFEAKYNFRFEQEGADQVVSYPRFVDDSVRVFVATASFCVAF
jgi:protein KRI1